MNIKAVIVGPIQVNCFIITCTTTKQTAIVDPGDDADDILNMCQSNSLDVTKILLTHGHFDHIGAVAPIKQATGAKVYMHRADEYLIAAAPAQAAAFGLPAPKTFRVDTYMDDGDDIALGDLKASVLATPGHTPGCVCFKFENDIFVGNWEVLPIGLHPDFINKVEVDSFLTESSDIKRIHKKRAKFDHKGTYGHGLLISGGYGKMGAAVLGSKAALRAGAGLITTHIPAKGYSILQTSVPEAMVSIDMDDEIFSEVPFLSKYNAWS